VTERQTDHTRRFLTANLKAFWTIVLVLQSEELCVEGLCYCYVLYLPNGDMHIKVYLFIHLSISI
jgi:hypothetical protein